MMIANTVTDILVLIGLFSFPPYLVYWIWLQIRLRTPRRLWWVLPALMAWMAATFFFLLLPMLACFGGGCADKVSPFLQYAVLYAAASLVLILLLYLFRRKNPN